MDGLDRLQEEILREADERARQIAANAEDYAKRTTEETEAKIHELESWHAAELTRELEALRLRSLSLADNERRKASLEQKRKLLDELPQMALALLQALPAAEKVQRYAAWVRRCAWTEGVISLSPAENEELMTALLAELGEGFSAGEPAEIAGGLLLSHGDTVENLSYDLYLRRNSAEISRFLALRLFAEEIED